MKSLVSTCTATSYAVPADFAEAVAVVLLTLLMIAVVAIALLSCDKTKTTRRKTALAVLRLLLRTLISVCVLLYCLHR